MKYSHAILGGTGHIGASLASALLGQQQSVLIIGHNPDKAKEWTDKGAAYEAVDILDTDRLRQLFQLAERLFILNPPAPPSTDTIAVETRQVNAILKAIEGLQLKKVVAASTYGAQKGDDIADLGVLYKLEQGLEKTGTPLAVIRSAYYMSNFDVSVEMVKNEGKLFTLYPADFKLPMVAPEDIGEFAARLMTDERTGLFFIEGPEYYSSEDVAAALGKALHRDVKVNSIPEAGWKDFLEKGGFSSKAAAYFVNMTRLTLGNKFEAPAAVHGKTALDDYFKKRLEQDN